MLDTDNKCPPAHSYLFGSDYVSVDALGKVFIMSVPLLPLRKVSHSKSKSAGSPVINVLKQNPCQWNHSGQGCKAEASLVLATSKTQYKIHETLTISRSCFSNQQQDKNLDQVETIPDTTILKRNLPNEEASASKALDLLEIESSPLQADECNNNFEDAELSPRLTNMIRSGIVPGSPINDNGQY